MLTSRKAHRNLILAAGLLNHGSFLRSSPLSLLKPPPLSGNFPPTITLSLSSFSSYFRIIKFQKIHLFFFFFIFVILWFLVLAQLWKIFNFFCFYLVLLRHFFLDAGLLKNSPPSKGKIMN